MNSKPLTLRKFASAGLVGVVTGGAQELFRNVPGSASTFIGVIGAFIAAVIASVSAKWLFGLNGMRWDSAKGSWVAKEARTHLEGRNRRRQATGLDAFSWLCRGESLAYVETAQADIRRRVKQLRKRGASERKIRCFVAWQATTVIVLIAADAIGRLATKLVPVGAMLKGRRPES